MLRTLVQFEKWDVILAGELLPVLARPRQEAWRHWARALAFANTGNASQAREELAQFDRALADYRARTRRANPTELYVARRELQAHLELADGHTGRALRQFEQASQAERRLVYTEPPYYPRPVAEPWGRAALKADHPRLSQRAFRIALQQYPNDAHASAGWAPLPSSSAALAAAQ
jgi:hypothetical protein